MGPPTERELDLQGVYTAKDLCVNKQTELWFAAQLLIMTSQVRGLDASVVNELIEMKAEVVNGKRKVLPKIEFRKQFGYSPDRAECCLFIIDLLRTRGLENGQAPSNFGVDAVINNPGFDRVTSVDDIFMNLAPRSYTESNPYVDARLSGLAPDGSDSPQIVDMTGNVFRWKQSMF